MTNVELVGGPLDGQEIDLDVEMTDPSLSSIKFSWGLRDEVASASRMARYVVTELAWRPGRLVLFFDGYEEP